MCKKRGGFIISNSLLFLVLIGVILLLMFIVPAVMSDKNSEEGKKACKISWAILGLLVLNWMLFLTDSYSLMPDNISNSIFTPVWIILSVAGIVAVIYEYKKNKGFAVSLAGLTTMSLLFTVLTYGIGEM